MNPAPGMLIHVEELGRDSAGSFLVKVSFGADAQYQVTITDPADDAVEHQLAWYFQDHLQYPFLDKDKEERAVQLIGEYGESLFGQLFGGSASFDYRRLRARSFDGCQMVVSGSAALHRLHWEALRDPDWGTPLAVQMPVTRKVSRQPSKFDRPADRPTLNILVVTARPLGAKDVGYRTISRPLLDSLSTARVPVTVGLVRPGTWQALRDHLQAVTKRYGSGWYQVVHFDLLGAFAADGAAGDRQRAFLSFETTREGEAEQISAQQVASLLAKHRVPVAVLNACQSAMQSESEAGLAQHLAEAGVPVAVGMAYSVTVSAAERAMPVLYRSIADGDDLGVAVTTARRELKEQPARQAYFDQELKLEDWLLPVMFAERPLQIKLQAIADDELRRFYERQAVVADEPDTEYGFVGRDLDIQAIEHRLLARADSNELLIQGMAGAGKSTLLRHLASWWPRTGLVDQVFSFSYEDRAWTAGQIIREIRPKLMSPAEHARADLMTEAGQIEQVLEHLRADRYLLILDNAESITGAPAAIPHSLNPPERDKLKAFLGRLRGGPTLVLLGSREAETWLTDGQGPGCYPLPGLDPQAASQLVDKILDRHGATRWIQHKTESAALQELVTLLGGYPLPLTVVLPVLAAEPPSTVLAQLRTGAAGADPAGLIRRAIEFSHGKLDPMLQNSLQLLAPFTHVIPAGPVLDRYQELLLRDDAVRRLGDIDLAAALAQAVGVGLAAAHSQLSHVVQVQPVLPWLLRSRLHDQSDVRAAPDRAHYQLYCDQISRTLKGMLTATDPGQRIAGLAAAQADYANLNAALAYALHHQLPIRPLILALDEYLDQAQQHETRRQLLDRAITAYPQPTSPAQQAELAQLHDLVANTALGQHRLPAAQAHYQAAKRLYNAAGERQNEAAISYQLGRLAQQQLRFAEAETAYRQALDLRRETDPRGASDTASRLGQVLAHLGRHHDAADALLYAATTWRQETGRWDRDGLLLLTRELAVAEVAQWTALVEANVPAELRHELRAALQATIEPDEPGESADR